MKINLIFVKDEDDEPEAAWIIDAWDEFSINNHSEGYEEALTKHRESHGHNNVRVLVIEISYESIEEMFKPHTYTTECTVVKDLTDTCEGHQV